MIKLTLNATRHPLTVEDVAALVSLDPDETVLPAVFQAATKIIEQLGEQFQLCYIKHVVGSSLRVYSDESPDVYRFEVQSNDVDACLMLLRAVANLTGIQLSCQEAVARLESSACAEAAAQTEPMESLAGQPLYRRVIMYPPTNDEN